MNYRQVGASDFEPNEIQASESWSDAQLANYAKVEAELNSQILEVTMTIRKEFPELSHFIEEMPQTVPDMKQPRVTLSNLTNYLESLLEMLKKYREDHRAKSAK